MQKRRVVNVVLIVVAAIVATPVLLVLLYLLTSGGDGSPQAAAQLRAVVEGITDPDAGEGIDPGYRAKRLPSGEWVLGVSRDSHGILSRFRGGGTIVLKDSRGDVRAFFGHVCGPAAHYYELYDAKSLDEVYANLRQRYTEYQWP